VPEFSRELRFGYFLVPNAGDPVVSMAQEIGRRWLGYVAIQDIRISGTTWIPGRCSACPGR
jgi:hypothetical protein